MKRLNWVLGAFALVMPAWLLPMAHRWHLNHHPSSPDAVLVTAAMAISALVLASIIAVPVALVLWIHQKKKGPAIPWARVMSNGLAMVVFVSCTVFGVFQVHELREDWVRGLVQELEPIQKEVDARHAETSTPPPLASLGTLPRKVKGRTFTHDGEWGISIELPLALSFDSLIYLPSRRYPEVGFGGKVVPVGEWAYIHE